MVPRLTDRWPSALAFVQIGVALFVIVGLQGEAEFAAGIAAMACIYMAAYAAGHGTAAWPAYPAVIAIWVILELFGIDARVSMTVLLFLLWIVAIARGRARDGRWFAIQTSGMVVFGGLTLLALPVDAQVAAVIAGVGFFAHGLWDAYHFAKNKVVNRPWSEMCVVVDLIVGPMLVIAVLLR